MVIEQFRQGLPRIADRFDREALLLLHTTGARSGEPRVSPLAYQSDGDRLFVVASAAGADRHPAWFHNLRADPRVRVERWAGETLQTFDGVAGAVDDDAERARLWERIVERMPGFADYQTKTDRVIPVVEIRRSS